MTQEKQPHSLDGMLGWWKPVVFAALAGGMGWGIRGQYGHETGAMIAGVLVCGTLVFLFAERLDARTAIRAMALGAVAMGIGGSMTYGQTVGWCHNRDVIGDWSAFRWGMLGLGIKGGLWIGFSGLFLGMGLGGRRYRPGELALLLVAMVALHYLGVFLLNSPFALDGSALPAIYFSGPSNPRPECWGGYLLALMGGLAYVSLRRKDALARNLCLWGLLGGGVGFPLGESLQAYHAWNPEVFEQGIWTNLDPFMNWWNMMEITFGATMGAALGLGLWFNRGKVSASSEPGPAETGPWPILIAVHLALLVCVEFAAVPAVDAVYDLGLILVIIPLAAIPAVRLWPYLVVLPVIMLPIAGKTMGQLVLEEEVLGAVPGGLLYLFLPLTLTTVAALWLATNDFTASALARRALLITAWSYFLLNYAFFHFPWPWAEWTGRTPSGIIFTVCLAGLTALALFHGRASRPAA